MKRLCLPAAVRHIQQSRHDTVARPAVILHSTLQIQPPQLKSSQRVHAMPRPQRDLGGSLPLHPCLHVMSPLWSLHQHLISTNPAQVESIQVLAKMIARYHWQLSLSLSFIFFDSPMTSFPLTSSSNISDSRKDQCFSIDSITWTQPIIETEVPPCVRSFLTD